MRAQDASGRNFDRIMMEINYDISLLYVIPCVYTRNMILNHLREKMFILESSMNVMNQPVQLQPQALPKLQRTALPGSSFESGFAGNQSGITRPIARPPLQSPATGNQTSYTLQELSRYDGKDGNPAFVAVNGIVYDVTDNAAWAAATHFGLTAGRDLTNAFASCHAGQPILNRLNAVGVLETV